MAEANDDFVTAASEAGKAIADMTPQEARAELAKREAQKMTRRAALAKMGVRGAMAIFAAFTVDDLARMVAKKLEQQAGQNAAIDEVARQLHNAGVAFALPMCEEIQADGSSMMVPCNKGGGGSPPNYNCPGQCDCNKKPTGESCCDGTAVASWCIGRYSTAANCIDCCNGVYNNFCKGYDGGNDNYRVNCQDLCRGHY